MINNRSIIMLLLLCLTGMAVRAFSQSIERVEPLCWWSGMRTPLQLMLYGKNIGDCQITITPDGLTVKSIHQAENPNYLFLDMDVQKAGKYTINLTNNHNKTSFEYEIFPRAKGSAQRKGFDNSDVIYLIMPDRFANGDPTNDTLPDSGQKIDRNNMEARHGGDIQGIINHLDYLSDLGVTTLWCTPLLEDTRYYHHYGITDYYRISPHFGSNELYRQMVDFAHRKGMKVIQDVTPQHCGIDHWWVKDPPFTDWLNTLELPPHYEYFSLEALSDPHAAVIDRDFCGSTILYATMPDMNLKNDFALKYMEQFAVWWIEYANLDGLRIDTYFYMGKKAADWTKSVRNEYPLMNMVGEIWGNQPALLAYWLQGANNADSFTCPLPMVMDFPLQAAIATDFTQDNAHWGGKMRTIYNALALDFVYPDAQHNLVTFAANHDTDRIFNILDKDKDKVKLALTLIATTRGIPQIFYGDELLFADDERGGPHKSRKDFPGGWHSDSIDLFTQQRNAEQTDMFNHLRTLLQFRKQTPALYNGRMLHYIPLDGLYVFFRYDERERIMVALNASEKKQTIDWEHFSEGLGDKQTGTELFSGKNIKRDTPLYVEPKSSIIIHFK